jgi:CheY-like chemotaxis protein
LSKYNTPAAELWSEPKDPAKCPPLRTYRILIVDDNQDAAEIMAMLLGISGHVVNCAYDGPSAIEAAREHAPEVVLLDIGLPGMNGYEVAPRLRALDLPNRLCLIALTGYGRDEDRQKTRAAGFDHHLVKPVDTQALNNILASIDAPAAR